MNKISELQSIDFRPFLPVIVIGMVICLLALIDLYRNRKERENVAVWLIVILLINMVGPVIYFVFGRKEKSRRE